MFFSVDAVQTSVFEERNILDSALDSCAIVQFSAIIVKLLAIKLFDLSSKA